MRGSADFESSFANADLSGFQRGETRNLGLGNQLAEGGGYNGLFHGVLDAPRAHKG